MFGFLKKLFGFRPPSQNEDPDEIIEEQWTADFTSREASAVRFSITSEKSYRANAGGGELTLDILKPNCLVWTEDSWYRYGDFSFKGKVRLDSRGGYAAAGFMFRMVDERTYYLVLVSGRGYFRLDLVRNGTPLTLAGWTEAPGVRPGDVIVFDLEVAAYGARLVLLINGQWAAECNEASLPEGRIAFAAACYESAAPAAPGETQETAVAALQAFSLDSRIEQAAERYDKAAASAPPENRVRLAETFTALGQVNPALVQLRKAWEDREAAAEALSEELESAEDAVILAAIRPDEPERTFRTTRELILASKLAMALELWDDAEEYINAAMAGSAGDPLLLGEARNIRASYLYGRNLFGELLSWACGILETETVPPFAEEAPLYNLLGNASFNLGDYRAAADYYDKAFRADGKNGLAARNAANSLEILGEREAALERYIAAGKAFLEAELYGDLGLLIPKYRLLGNDDWEARGLTGKWAFGIEDWKTAVEEIAKAEELRKKGHAASSRGAKRRYAPDPALYYLDALLHIRAGKRREALPLLEKAVKYAPDYPLFRFRLAENRFFLPARPEKGAVDPGVTEELESALALVKPEDGEIYGWVHNFAAHIALSGEGDAEKAAAHLAEAARILGEVPAVRVNRAVSLYLKGSADEALAVLQSRVDEDPEGLMANCAGNLLVRSGRLEEAEEYYKKALLIAPENIQYRYNRASILIELARYGEADTVLTSTEQEAAPDMLELISFVAVKKGEYKRAETASRAALALDPGHIPSLLHLGWNCAAGGRWNEVKKILGRLDALELREELARGRDELRARMETALFRTVPCGVCGREWRVNRNPAPVPSLRLFAMPPDVMPAGTCPECGKSFCVGCRKDSLDGAGRFTCPECGAALKLIDEGLKELVHQWAADNLPKKAEKKRKKKTGKPKQAKPEILAEPPQVPSGTPDTAAGPLPEPGVPAEGGGETTP